ncbi:MAG: YifB family Mg chelatase-like AAA ATPase [Alphaproteobacteria bacterium]|nr:YifB family Mg chelatase-like AAA ATPase [Rickettsiales bacterium]
MISRVRTVAFFGLELKEVDVQVHFSKGIPGLVIVGLVSKTVAEAKERIRAAISSAGFSFPAKRIIVNLAPADFLKEGTRFDLPIALAILMGMGVIDSDDVGNSIVLGELSLDGNICSVRGVLPVGVYAAQKGYKLICPYHNRLECVLLDKKLPIIVSSNLNNLISLLKDKQFQFSSDFSNTSSDDSDLNSVFIPDMASVRGQSVAKRAVIIAACGGHNILLSGHPGTGKSMLASAFSGILPPLTHDEIIEVTSIYSLSGLIKDGNFISKRPYRAPHHSASDVSIVGGGRAGQLGEITLAHKGVLFLDELPEFDRKVLDSLRQPLENGSISIARADYRVSYPAKFQLFAAMNQCKCGYFGDAARQCRKVPQCGRDYESKVSGPIMDRFDIVVQIETEIEALYSEQEQFAKTSKDIRSDVAKVREIQALRYKADGLDARLNSELSKPSIDKHCILCQESKDVVQKYVDKFGLSMRGYAKVLKIARTIADMEGLSSIKKDNIIESLNYRRRAI